MWFLVGADGTTADATTLVFSRVGVGKEGGNLLVLVPSPSLFCCVEQMTGLEPAASTLGGWRSSW